MPKLSQIVADMRQHRIDRTEAGRFLSHNSAAVTRLAEAIPAEIGERYSVRHLEQLDRSGLDVYAIQREVDGVDDVWISRTEIQELAAAGVLDSAHDVLEAHVANLRKRDEAFQGSLGADLQEEHEVNQALYLAEAILGKLRPTNA